MKNLLYTGYFLLLYMKITWSKEDKKQTTVHVNDRRPHTLTSPYFPNCCQPVQYLLESDLHNKSNPSNWRLLFTDLDIPPGSELLIYGYKEKNSQAQPLHSPKYSPDGAWLRPVIIYQGYGLGINFIPAKPESKHYLGFNVTYWLAPESEWNIDRPFTVCPVVGDAMEGGVLEVTVFLQPVRIHHYRFMCIWQLKPPPSKDLRMYIDIYAARDSNVLFRQGTHSGKPLLFEIDNADYPPISLPRRLTSDHGFYIELDKPTDSGNFTIVYGVYKAVEEDEECQYHIDNEKLEGFRCKDSGASWCIPEESKCNGISDCPEGEDESAELCQALVTMTPLPSILPCIIHQCEDGRCRNYLQRCPEEKCPASAPVRCEGTLNCIVRFLPCPGDNTCPYLHKYCPGSEKCVMLFLNCPEDEPKKKCDMKECRDGSCIRYYQRCPDDACPTYKPNKCGGQCYYDHDKCNGVVDCYDGSDEDGCYKESKKGITITPGTIGGSLVVATALGLFAVIYCSAKEKSQKKNQKKSDPFAETETGQERLVPFSYSRIGLHQGDPMAPPPSYDEAISAPSTSRNAPVIAPQHSAGAPGPSYPGVARSNPPDLQRRPDRPQPHTETEV